MDAHLPVSFERVQYVAWREQLLSYWAHDAKRTRPCVVAGCDSPRRAKGLAAPLLRGLRAVNRV